MFYDRKDGGEQLGKALDKYKDKGVIVLGIPRGGAETAYYVAKHLNAEFSLLISRKLGHPYNPEFAFGALAEDGSMYINEITAASLSKEDIQRVVTSQKQEIKRRIMKLRGGKPLPDLKNKIVILTDDGIATGATFFAAIKMCKKQMAEKIIVAAPVSARETAERMKEQADEVVVLDMPEYYFAVSQGYESFYNLTDEQALSFMQRWEKEKQESSPRQVKKTS